MKTPIFSTGLRWLWLTVLVLILDIAIKQYVYQNFRLYVPIEVTSFFNLMYAQNFGAAFSF